MSCTIHQDVPDTMLRLITDMRLLSKIAIPAAVIGAACLAIVIYAAVSLHSLAEKTDSTIQGEARRVELALEAEALFNSAAVTEKNIILYPQESDARAGIDQYGKITDRVVEVLATLSDITEAADQRDLIETFRAAVARRREVSGRVFELALRKQTAEAFALSAGPGARERRVAIETVDRLIALNRTRLEEARKGAHALAEEGRTVLIATSVVGLCIAFALLGWIAAFQIGRPLGRMTQQMQRLADGDLTLTVAGAERRDEVGALARSLEVFKQNALTARRLEAEQRDAQIRKEQRQNAMEQLIGRFDGSAKEAIGMLAAAATQLSATSKSMSGTAGETTRQAEAVAAGSAEASANVQTVAAAAEQLSASVQEISRQVATSASMASEAVTDAEGTRAKMQALSEAAGRIGDVVSLIQSIASQTNLLALNATIEAARAGEHGKGFAVVASEVKGLAGQTARATEEIGAQIGAIQSATAEAAAAIRSIGATIGRIDEIAGLIASGVEAQGTATLEIARNVQEAARGTQKITSSIVGVNQAAVETGGAAGEVLTAADELARQGERLRREIDEFLASMRAA